MGDFEGLLMLTWDANEKAYKAYAFGNDYPGAIVETGQFEGDALVYRSELTAGGTSMKLRNVTRVTAPGQLVSEEYVAKKEERKRWGGGCEEEVRTERFTTEDTESTEGPECEQEKERKPRNEWRTAPGEASFVVGGPPQKAVSIKARIRSRCRVGMGPSRKAS
jgi:hypothetical protein